MKKIMIAVIVSFIVCTAAFAQADRNTRYVAVKNITLKSSDGFFANDVGILSLGDAVTLVSEKGKWSQIKTSSVTGWVETSKLSARQVLAVNSTGVSANEVALAGKGFSPETEREYKKNGLDYSLVDEMEKLIVNANELLKFITEGNLAKGD